MKIATGLSEKLGLRLPLIQAPMAGGPSSQELVVACSAAGALGSFGFAIRSPRT
jgi:nitronate monooxygenase